MVLTADSPQDALRWRASVMWQLFAALAAVQLRERPEHEQSPRSGSGNPGSLGFDVVALLAVCARAVRRDERHDA